MFRYVSFECRSRCFSFFHFNVARIRLHAYTPYPHTQESIRWKFNKVWCIDGVTRDARPPPLWFRMHSDSSAACTHIYYARCWFVRPCFDTFSFFTYSPEKMQTQTQTQTRTFAHPPGLKWHTKRCQIDTQDTNFKLFVIASIHFSLDTLNFLFNMVVNVVACCCVGDGDGCLSSKFKLKVWSKKRFVFAKQNNVVKRIDFDSIGKVVEWHR